MRARFVLLLMAAAGVVAGAGCTPTFDNSTTLKDLRLIAVRADPPEFLVDLPALMENPALLSELPTFAIAPLVIDPHGGGRAVDYRVEACGNRPGETERGGNNGPGRVNDTIAQAPCPAGALPVAEGSAVASEDGSVPIEFTFRPTAELLIQAAMDDPLSLELGLPITLSFTIRAGDEQVVAVKRVLFTPQLAPDQIPNRNPEITHLSIRATRDDALTILQPDAPPSVPLGGKLRLAPAPADAEPYRARAFSRNERRFVTEEVSAETLRYTFYTTHGIFSPGGASTFPSPLRNDPLNEIETSYEAPAELPAGGSREVFLFVVVRDERGGASFIRGRLTLDGPAGQTAERGRAVSAPPAVRRLDPEDAEALLELRQSALRNEPLAFGTVPGGERGNLSWVRDVLGDRGEQAVFGGFEQGELRGMVGVGRETAAKERHRAGIWGMYVAASARRRGLGRALLQAAIDHARRWPGVEQLGLSVTETAAPARRLYESVGFRIWGRQPRVLQWQGQFVDEDHLTLDLRGPTGS